MVCSLRCSMAPISVACPSQTLIGVESTANRPTMRSARNRVTTMAAGTRGTPCACSHLTIGRTMVAITQASTTGTITGRAA